MISGCHIRINAIGRMQRVGEKVRCQMRGIDRLAVDGDRLVCNHIGRIERVLVAFRAVFGRVDIVDQPLVERPGIDLAFPFVNDRISEAIVFRLQIGGARRNPGRPCGLQSGLGRCGEEIVDRLVQTLRPVSAS